ncbi:MULTISPECIES: phosphate acetyltransferase [unclassified Lentimicrobium]|uniref:phosphate acetyltransferase n=1 Tax=unclassified Lentimicrobium TaxID=2677434 RepID=UPI00155334C1|nr:MULTISPECIES: phosphate acetyltransferase [unclassified Lentimicrobium]NPD44077.1 phosphate acetyltransferase [Lentimicrobium sp. S6]NPD86740.1 phosphate acetyltransferase [Lentimicrobium sp. L6]
MNFIEGLREEAKKNIQKIVLPEGNEERTLKAADYAIAHQIAEIILIGNPTEIRELAQKYDLTNLEKAQIINPNNFDAFEEYVDLLLEIRGKKIKSREEAEKLVRNPLYLATLLVKNGKADGEVAGAENSTGDVLRPAFQIVKTLPGISVVSGAFFMVFENKEIGDNGIITFADCAVHPNPTASELAEIAVASARTTKAIAGLEPRVALLSFSTKGSAKHEMVDKVVEATAIAQKMAPEFKIDGELQADAAIIPGIGSKKAPDSEIAGRANVLVFPTLEVGNIAYKLVQRLAGAEAVGPVLQGMAAPINDLSRGCSADDIINMIAITSLQAADKF